MPKSSLDNRELINQVIVIICILLILYIVFIVNKLPDSLDSILNNNYFKYIVVLGIAYVCSYNSILGLFLGIAFIVSVKAGQEYNMINEYIYKKNNNKEQYKYLPTICSDKGKDLAMPNDNSIRDGNVPSGDDNYEDSYQLI